jgi:four helix bundle protein
MEMLRNLKVWKRACRLSVDMYALTGGCSDWGFRNQITRSALSIPSNIAEGYERDSAGERCHFLRIAKGSCAECWTQLLIGIEAGLVDRAKARPVLLELEEISAMIAGLVKHFGPAEASEPKTPST